jgi:hypothetical protein
MGPGFSRLKPGPNSTRLGALVHPARRIRLRSICGGVTFDRMSEVTIILGAIAQGDPSAAGQLLPLVYQELRRLAAHKLAQEKPGQTLDATSLVHEAYLRLSGPDPDRHWQGRGHFFAAAGEAMRRILVDRARCKRSGGRAPEELDLTGLGGPAVPGDLQSR